MPISYPDYRKQVLAAFAAYGYQPDSYCQHDEQIEDGYEDETPVQELVERILGI